MIRLAVAGAAGRMGRTILSLAAKDSEFKIVAGFETQIMPTYGFTDVQIADIVAYIKTLK